MWICIGIPLVIGVVIALAARCGLPHRDNFYAVGKEPISW
jgi:uncharacterized membrane-anchored protein YhcB (DUF1043 family)